MGNLLFEAVEKFLALALVDFSDAEKEVIIEGNGGSIGVVAEFVFGDFPESISSFKDDGGSVFEGGVDVVADREGGGHDSASANTFTPFFFTCFGVPAVGPTVIGDGVNEAFVREEGLLIADDDIFPGDLTGAIGHHAGGLSLGKTAAGEDHVVMPDDGAARGLGSGFGLPVEFAGVRGIA